MIGGQQRLNSALFSSPIWVWISFLILGCNIAPSSSPLIRGQMAPVSSKTATHRTHTEHTHTRTRKHLQEDQTWRSYQDAPAVLPDAGAPLSVCLPKLNCRRLKLDLASIISRTWMVTSVREGWRVWGGWKVRQRQSLTRRPSAPPQHGISRARERTGEEGSETREGEGGKERSYREGKEARRHGGD